MDTEDRQAEIDGVNWYHEFDFGNGLKARSRVPNIAGHRTSWQFIEQQLEKVEFRDKAVLDVGCWDGRWSFFAERRGAKSVLASDDVSQNWSNGQGLRLAREFFQSQIEVNQDLSIYSLASLSRTFDIVMCLGVYYHLLDPFFAFSQIRHCCHRNSVVLLEGEIGMALPPNHLIYTLDNPSVLKFLPSGKALENLLFAAYLRVTSQVWSGPHNKARALLGRLRHGTAVSRRIFIVCVPFEGENDHHAYAPPFGLGAYDPRFRDTSTTASTIADSLRRAT